jgi:5-methylcytosine-specific restriction protein B
VLARWSDTKPNGGASEVREAFRTWLQGLQVLQSTRDTQWSDAARLERLYGDLDALFDADRFASLKQELTYSKDDERAGRPNPSKIVIDGDLYANLAHYRGTVKYYERFRDAEAGGAIARTGLRRDELEALKRLFLQRCPDFLPEAFGKESGFYFSEERRYKDEVISRVKALIEAPAATPRQLGEALIETLQKPPANFIGWRTLAEIKAAEQQDPGRIAGALGELVLSDDDASIALQDAADAIHPSITGGSLRTLVTTVLALARPDDALAVKTQYIERVARQLTGQGLFKSQVLQAGEYDALLELAQSIFEIMQGEWEWAPRDLWDVQGFLWVTSDAYGNVDPDEVQVVEPLKVSQTPTNLILYGPPGTGKTYATASKAVAICDGQLPPGGRDELMARYRELVAKKRISFVTFHQSYSYEDFVEGLRPYTGDDEGEGSQSGGFSLRAEPGVFRQIAMLARDNHGRTNVAEISAAGFSSDRMIFKMSLGRSGDEVGTRVYRACMDEGFVVTGWGGDIDWSPPQFEKYPSIRERWREDHPGVSGNDGNIRQTYCLRGLMKPGDLVVVTDGNKKFRAVGEVTGPYQFVPDFIEGYNHRRTVKWLWRNDQGLPRELIYPVGFTMTSLYQLDERLVDWPALEQIVSGGGEAVDGPGEPEPFVLIIDEINRANVSKVFGELITLIEPDKRLGATNELTVTLPYSREVFGVPPNLNIIGTMNTADRSIALLDTALRRRFEFEELMPDPSALAAASQRTGIDLVRVLTTLNQRIEYLFDRDHQIGHAFLMGCDSAESVGTVMRTKVIPLLVEYFYEDWEKVRQVLGETTDTGAFVGRVALPAPGGLSDFSDEMRWRYAVHPGFSLDAYGQLGA